MGWLWKEESERKLHWGYEAGLVRWLWRGFPCRRVVVKSLGAQRGAYPVMSAAKNFEFVPTMLLTT